MRAGKRQKLVEAKRTRSCVVRLQKVPDIVQENKSKAKRLAKTTSLITKKKQLLETLQQQKNIKTSNTKPVTTLSLIKINDKKIKSTLSPAIASRVTDSVNIKTIKSPIVSSSNNNSFTIIKPSKALIASNNNNNKLTKTPIFSSNSNHNKNVTITKSIKSNQPLPHLAKVNNRIRAAPTIVNSKSSRAPTLTTVNKSQIFSDRRLKTNRPEEIRIKSLPIDIYNEKKTKSPIVLSNKEINTPAKANKLQIATNKKYQLDKSIEEEQRQRTNNSEMSAKGKPRGRQRKNSLPVVVPYETPPTIAAGRSRRAIKPNPKYASDDVVTPKIMKNVVNHSLHSTPHRKYDSSFNRTRHDSSSSEDFFNKDSDDDLLEEKNNYNDKAYNVSQVIDTPIQKRKRGRPKKSDTPHHQQASTTTISTRRTTTTTPKSSQLQQLRKSFISSNALAVARYDPQQTIKRKMETNKLKLDEPPAKKMLLPTKYKIPTIDSPASRTILTRKIISSTATSASNKVVSARNETKLHKLLDDNFDEKTALVPYGSSTSRSAAATTANAVSTPTNALSSLTNNGCKSIRVVTPKFSSAHKLPTQSNGIKTDSRRSLPVQPAIKALPAPSSTATSATPITNSNRATGSTDENNKIEASPSSTIDDFETMPTFTIVNINDIINKKGDVLITKTGAAKGGSVTQKPKPKSIEFDKSNEDEVTSSTSPVVETVKPNRRKSPHNNNIREIEPLVQNPPTLTRAQVLQRKQAMLATNSALNKAVSSSTDRPAPRILNSVVGKRTQPIKPMISNVSSSYGNNNNDGSSLDEDDGDGEARTETVRLPTNNNATTPSTTTRRYPSLAAAKAALLSSKENSLAVVNSLASPRTPRLRLNNDLTVSRLGNKVVKRMTCFETWYVINIKETPNKIIRNIFEIPLIKLANIVDEVQLPSKYWSNKVTLFEVPAAAINKSALQTFEGDLSEHNIPECDRHKYQPSCVMFRRAVSDRTKSRLPYDRAVIFKNKTFFTNIEGKNIKLIGAPSTISTTSEIEILLQIVDTLSLHSHLVEPTSTI